MIEITRKDKIRNTLQQTEKLVDKIRKKRLTWFGHVSRMHNNIITSEGYALSYSREKKPEKTAQEMDRVCKRRLDKQ